MSGRGTPGQAPSWRASDGLGDFSYARISSTEFTLKVKLTTGWSETFGPVALLSGLTATPGG